MPVALRIVVTGINHACHFTWQAEYLVRLEGVAPRIVSDVSCVTWINDESHFLWQAQYLGRHLLLRAM